LAIDPKKVTTILD
jgi:hypothetical protein